LPATTIIIVTHNRRDYLGKVFESLKKQMEEQDQLVVVDDASTDGTDKLVQKVVPAADYSHIPAHEGYCLSARINHGLELAGNDMIWRLDSDCIPFDDALALFKEFFAEDRIIAGAIMYADERRKVKAPDHPWRLRFLEQLARRAPWEVEHWKATAELYHPVMCFGGNLVFSKKTALAIGGFDSDFDGSWGAEDAWLADQMMWKLGCKLLYAPGAAVIHQWHPQSGEHRKADAMQKNLELWNRKSAAMKEQVRTSGCTPGLPLPELAERTSCESSVPYALLSITGAEMQNAGNLLVESTLRACLPKPTITTSVFRMPQDSVIEAIRTSGCRLAICSGTTVLGDGTPLKEWAAALAPVPLVVVGGCMWEKAPSPIDQEALAGMIVSARDSYTAERLEQVGIKIAQVGCPSTLLRAWEWPDNSRPSRLALGFHRSGHDAQIAVLASLARKLKLPITLLVQERYEIGLARRLAAKIEKEIPVEVVDLERIRTPDQWAALFGGFTRCFSGRLHQVLPAAALGVPSLLFVPEEDDLADSRCSLLADLGIPSVSLQGLVADDLPDLAASAEDGAVAEANDRLLTFLREVFDNVAPQN
jgi:GT2 family glycosyltransferase